jgi:predicted phage terminase large subunit-like protein
MLPPPLRNSSESGYSPDYDPNDVLADALKEKDRRLAEKAEGSFYEFIKQAWPEVDPANPFIDNWHVGCIAEHLQALHYGQIKRLVFNMPPGGAKSVLLCVMMPAWEWVRNPMLRYMTGSYSEGFAIRDSMRGRRLMESKWYQDRWGDRFRLGGSDLQSAKGRYENDKTGYRIAFGIKGGLGERGDRLFVDDPHKTKEASSDAEREQAVTNYRETMATRANNIETAAWAIIMQRLHERDLAGQMIEMGYEACVIPMRYDPAKPWKKLRVDFRYVDPRTEYGELLFTRRWPEDEVQRLEKMLGLYAASGQLQQDPSPADGGIFKRKWFCKFWQRPGDNLPPYMIRVDGEEVATELMTLDPDKVEELAISIDCTFKDVKDSDFVAIQVWGRKGADRILLDQDLRRLDFPATLTAVRSTVKRWPRAGMKLIEDKANGSAVISTLKHEIPGIVPVSPEGGKESRAAGVSPQFEAGNIWLPHPNLAPWVLGFIEQFVAFPNAAHDDCVDAASQLLGRWLGGWLGAIEYLKRENGIEESDVSRKKKQAIATAENTVRCPKCDNVGVQYTLGQGFRCQQCGHQFGTAERTLEMPKRGAELRKGPWSAKDAVATQQKRSGI